LGMRDRARLARQWVDNRGIELRLLAIFRGIWRFVRPAHAYVQRQATGQFPIVLRVPCLAPPAREPSGKILCVNRAAHRSEQERGEWISRVRREWKLRAAEVVRTGRRCLYRRIVAGSRQLVPEFERVLPL